MATFGDNKLSLKVNKSKSKIDKKRKRSKNEISNKKRKLRKTIEIPEKSPLNKDEKVVNENQTKISEINSENEQNIEKFNIPLNILENLRKQSIYKLFEIQSKSFETIFNGKDFIGRARTGQGKTLAFVLPIASRILKNREINGKNSEFLRTPNAPLAIVLCPVRELATQVATVFEKTCGRQITVCTVFGGVSYEKQQTALIKGVDVVIGTCGRVKDLIEKEYLNLTKIRFAVLDEVDEMLNVGFADDVEHILNQIGQKINQNSEQFKKSQNTQVLLFSATLPLWVNRIAEKYLKPDHQKLDLVGSTRLQTSHTIDHLAACCHHTERNAVLSSYLASELDENESAIVFSERKRDCNEIASNALTGISCRVLHGDIPQSERSITLESFRKKEFSVLVATDVAARGISIKGVTLVVQLSPPKNHEIYIHRSGRTGRAGEGGKSVLFYTPRESNAVSDIEQRAKINFRRIGAPSPNTMAMIAMKSLKMKIQKIDKQTLDTLRPIAKSLLSEVSPEESVILALTSEIGGKKRFEIRSILSGTPGRITILLKSDKKLTPTIVRQHYRQKLSNQSSSTVNNLTMLRDGKGAVFDINAKYEEEITQLDSKNPSFEIATSQNIPRLSSFSLNSLFRPKINPYKNQRNPQRRHYTRNNGNRNIRRNDNRNNRFYRAHRM